MKTTIASLLMHNALDHTKRSLSAEKKGKVREEICHSIGAHLMVALVLEAIGNEISETLFNDWVWRRIEKMDTTMKWYIISGLDGKKQFDPSKEPLQTIQYLQATRNKIVHPKVIDRGEEIMLISRERKLHRSVSMDKKLEEGDEIIIGHGKLFDQFNAKTAKDALDKTIKALKYLREHLEIVGYEWIDGFEKKFSKVNK